jgi:hypothetical protein
MQGRRRLAERPWDAILLCYIENGAQGRRVEFRLSECAIPPQSRLVDA